MIPLLTEARGWLQRYCMEEHFVYLDAAKCLKTCSVFHHSAGQGCLCSMLWVIIPFSHSEVLSNQFCNIWLNLSRDYSYVYFRIHALTYIYIYISTNISDSFPLAAKQSHAITLPPPCLANIVVWLDVPLGCNVFEMDTRYDLSISQWPFADSGLSWRCNEMLHTHGLWEPWASHHRGTQTCLRGVSSLSPDLVSSEGDWSRRKGGTRVQSPWDISDCPSICGEHLLSEGCSVKDMW